MPNFDNIDLTNMLIDGDPYGEFENGGSSDSFDPNSLSASTNQPADADEIITGENGTWYRKAFSKVWDYIKGKIKSVLHVDTGTIDDIVNVYGAKNLIPNQALDDTWKGITWKVNSDGTLSASGTATADSLRTIVEAFEIPVGKYILNGCPSGSGLSTYFLNFFVESGTVTPDGGNDTGEGLEFEVTQTAKITVKARVLSGQTVNIAFKPMIRLASITDDTYEPYAKTNLQLTQETTGLLDNTEVNGAVNMLPNTATTQVINGITFTVNDNGTVTANGTATANAELILLNYANVLADSLIEKISNKTVKLSGCPSGGSSSTYHVRKWGQGSTGTYYDNGEGVVFTPSETSLSDNQWNFQIRIMSGKTVSNLTFKPMLTVASYNGDYIPYAKSNKDLTEDTIDLFSKFTDGNITSYFKLRSGTMNMYWTADASPSDYNNLSQQERTDLAQAVYDLFKKLGGQAKTVYIGRLVRKSLKNSDGTQIGSAEGFFVLYSAQTYASTLSDNSKARIVLTFIQYGNATLTQYGLWANSLRYSNRGIVDNADTTKTAKQCVGTYNTISAYKG